MKKLLLLCLGLCALCAEPKVLIFGDSNTFGTAFYGTHPQDLTFGGLAQNELKGVANVKVNGLPGRTIALDIPTEQFNGLRGLKEAFSADLPDILVIMLGTNDLLIGAKTSDALKAYEALIDFAKKQGVKDFLIIAPPLLEFSQNNIKENYKAFCEGLEILVKNYTFLSAGKLIGEAGENDKIHLDLNQHQKLGDALALTLKSMINESKK